MSQPITTSVTMDAESFQKFRSFDLFHHQKRWQRPLLFAAILLGSSGICLSQVGVREGASLLAVVLAIVALGLPAVYFYTFFRDLRTTIQKLGLPRPFYRLRLDDAGLSVWMAGEQDKPQPSHQYPWQDLHVAYRTPDAVYLYVQQTQAYLVNGEERDTVWDCLKTHLPASRPDGVLPSPVSWGFFCAKTTKSRRCYDMIRLTAKTDGEPYFILDF